MRKLLPLALVVALAASCGGRKVPETTVAAPARTTTAPTDPGRDTLAAFVAAARAGNAFAMWELLSTGTRRRLGPTIGRFRQGVAQELHEGLGSFGRYRLVLSERITPEFGVVAIDGERAVEGRTDPGGAVGLCRAPSARGKRWKLELAGPVQVEPIGPDPGAREGAVAQIAAAVRGPAGTGTALMWLDGLTLFPEVRGTASNVTMFANFPVALDPGRHTVVVFAAGPRDASATAWAFTVKLKK